MIALDQGTTSTRAVAFDRAGKAHAQHQIALRQHYPADGWVEHDATEIWAAAHAVVKAVADKVGPASVAAIGITNQRETTVLWDRRTGRPLANAIVWQDRRTAEACAALKARGLEGEVQRRTGLLLDPYFSATKIAWLLDHVADGRARAEAGELCAGTVDAWLVFNLTGGAVHATDATNASRTMLFDIQRQTWDPDLLRALRIPESVLPEVKDCAGLFGTTDPDLFGVPVPIMGIAGDQQAATIGQACFAPGMSKSTYGTGCFMLVNTGERCVASRNRLLTTVAYRLDGRTSFAIEGSIFAAGATVQWLRDGLGVIRSAAESEALARSVPGTDGVYLVPAFTGLGAPHWDPDARAAILGLTRDSEVAHIVRAALESVAYQTADLAEAMAADMSADAASRGAAEGDGLASLRVDGGMVANDWLCQFLADILARPVERPAVIETTALGAAYLAGLGAGLHGSLAEVAAAWRLDRCFEPRLAADRRQALLAGWHKAVARIRG